MTRVPRPSRSGELLSSTAPAPEPISTTPKPDRDPGNAPPARGEPAKKPQPTPASPRTSTTHQRHGDRSSGEDADDGGDGGDNRRRGWPAPLRFVRFNDLVAAGIVKNWVTLGRMIKEKGFPAGLLLGPNMRAWEVDKVEAWLAARPTATKIPENAIRARERKRAAAS